MRLGKLSETVMKRSVLKNINRQTHSEMGAFGISYGMIRPGGQGMVSVCAKSAVIAGHGAEGFLLHSVANRLAASGAVPTGIAVNLLLPESAAEGELKEVVRNMEAVCDILKMQVLHVDVQVQNVVKAPVLSVVGMGTREEQTFDNQECMEAGMDIVMSKRIGLSGTSILANAREEELMKSLPIRLIETAKEFADGVSVVPEARVACRHGAAVMHTVSEGGIFGALWEMAEMSKTGLEIELRKIPLHQETVEICECLQLNPYLLHSEGALLMAAKNGQDLVRQLQSADIEASVIGRATAGNDRILINEEEKRFLDLPAMDELYKVL